MKSLIVIALVTGCASLGDAPVGVDPGETGPGGGGGGGGSDNGSGGMSTPTPIPDVQCAGEPDAGAAGSLRHWSSHAITFLGHPYHRGIDLVATANEATQRIEGAISYTVADKALEDEDVDLFACRAGAWEKLGTARTDTDGLFHLDLTAGTRLPIGMRDMFVSVGGDRTGAKFLAYVAPESTKLVASDVDGTLTATENAFLQSRVTGATVGVQPGAASAFVMATTRGYQPVYVTARGQQYTAETRTWLAANGFPRGPLRLSPSFVTLPGGDTIDFKVTAMLGLAGFDLAAGDGNRASDITAYTRSGLAPSKIFVNRPEYTAELAAELAAHHATPFDAYSELLAVFAQL